MSNHVMEGGGRRGNLPPTAYQKERGIPSRTGGILLCYGCCENCGWWCAIREGGTWPDCPDCGAPRESIMPSRLESFDPELYVDHPGGEPKAFVAFFMPEREALEVLRRPQGITDPRPKDTP